MIALIITGALASAILLGIAIRIVITEDRERRTFEQSITRALEVR